jgi:hypothetical protein
MAPTPPMPFIHGSTTPIAKAAAMAASTACPPAFRTRAPTSDAARFCVTTIPPRERAEGLRTRRRCDRLGETTETVLGMAGGFGLYQALQDSALPVSATQLSVR